MSFLQPWASGVLASGKTAAVTDVTPTAVIAGTANHYTYIHNILVTNSNASVGVQVDITEETTGTVLMSGYAESGGSGFSVTMPAPLKVPTIGKGINITCGANGASIIASAVGFKSTVSY